MASATRVRLVADAARDVERAKQAISDAEEALLAAYDRLDAALASRWRRIHGAIDGRLYENRLFPGSLVSLDQVLEAVAAEDEL